MEKCSCWNTKSVVTKWRSGTPIDVETVQYCNGTKEQEVCSCGGDVSKCDFYPEKRKEGKGMNTAEMWLKAQEDGMYYETIKQCPDGVTLFYQKGKGLIYDDDVCCSPNIWNYFDDLMNEQWQIRVMTKSEAEAKFNIKIVGD